MTRRDVPRNWPRWIELNLLKRREFFTEVRPQHELHLQFEPSLSEGFHLADPTVVIRRAPRPSILRASSGLSPSRPRRTPAAVPGGEPHTQPRQDSILATGQDSALFDETSQLRLLPLTECVC